MSVIFIDLSMASDIINHDRLLAKLKIYGFSKRALSLGVVMRRTEGKEFKSTTNLAA